jgi:hypothetical protein
MRLSIAILLLAAGSPQQQPEAPEIAAKDFQRLYDSIRPQPGESPWRDIDWMTSIRGAREKAAAEGKPILVFTAADGSPLART